MTNKSDQKVTDLDRPISEQPYSPEDTTKWSESPQRINEGLNELAKQTENLGRKKFKWPLAAGVTSADIGKMFYIDGDMLASVGTRINQVAASAASATMKVNAPYADANELQVQPFSSVVFASQPNNLDVFQFKTLVSSGFQWTSSKNGTFEMIFTTAAETQAWHVQIQGSIAATIDRLISRARSYAGSTNPAQGHSGLFKMYRTGNTLVVVADALIYPGGAFNTDTATRHLAVAVGTSTDANLGNQTLSPTADNGRFSIPYVSEGNTINDANVPANMVALTNGVSLTNGGQIEVQNLTVRGHLNVNQGDFLLVPIPDGTNIAIWFDKNNNGTPPTAASFLAADLQLEVDVSTGDSDFTILEKILLLNPVSKLFIGTNVADSPRLSLAPLVAGNISPLQARNSNDTADSGVVEHIQTFQDGSSSGPNTVQFVSQADGIDVTLTAGVDFALESTAQDQADALFAALDAAVVHANLVKSQNGLEITIDRNIEGNAQSYGFVLGGGSGSEHEVIENDPGADFNDGFGARAMGSLHSISGPFGFFYSPHASIGIAAEDIAEGDILALDLNGTIRIGDPGVDWIIGRAENAATTGNRLEVGYYAANPNGWQGTPPSSLEDAVQRLEQVLITQIYGAIPMP